MSSLRLQGWELLNRVRVLSGKLPQSEAWVVEAMRQAAAAIVEAVETARADESIDRAVGELQTWALLAMHDVAEWTDAALELDRACEALLDRLHRRRIERAAA